MREWSGLSGDELVHILRSCTVRSLTTLYAVSKPLKQVARGVLCSLLGMSPAQLSAYLKALQDGSCHLAMAGRDGNLRICVGATPTAGAPRRLAEVIAHLPLRKMTAPALPLCPTWGHIPRRAGAIVFIRLENVRCLQSWSAELHPRLALLQGGTESGKVCSAPKRLPTPAPPHPRPPPAARFFSHSLTPPRQTLSRPDTPA